ncbi:hypothetical protein BU16DRAFT_566276 [Lophium mytilinum]|uniref:Uncharacterized protein n=1 Tax=Lophium mytilinum TaxID=390894 RepID=A0A6A6QCX1_9PEZI|nr:hypothetical protein BU16DRAFT_566276 [Lophium mytilinum]
MFARIKRGPGHFMLLAEHWWFVLLMLVAVAYTYSSLSFFAIQQHTSASGDQHRHISALHALHALRRILRLPLRNVNRISSLAHSKHELVRRLISNMGRSGRMFFQTVVLLYPNQHIPFQKMRGRVRERSLYTRALSPLGDCHVIPA